MRCKGWAVLVAMCWLASIARGQGASGPGAFCEPMPPADPAGAFQPDPRDLPIPAESAFVTPPFPNGFSEEDHSCGSCPPTWQFGAGYLFVWFTRNTLPGGVLTTGDPSDTAPGALGQPGTRPLGTDSFGDFPAAALNLTAFRWLGEAGRWSLDARYMLMEQRSAAASFSSNDQGSPVLARPFFNPVANREDADPRAIPNGMAGSASTAFNTNFQQAEANLRWYTSGQQMDHGGIFTALVGTRWVQLRERFKTADSVTDLQVGSPLASNYFISDRFATRNQFFGGQLGLGVIWRYYWFELEILGKVAIGCNWEDADISGLTTITNQTTGATVSDAIGLYAQRSNSGTFSDSRLTYIPELDIRASVRPWDCLKIVVGYDLLSMQKVVRPGSLVDRNVNIQPLLAPTQLGPALPSPRFERSSFVLQGLSIGLELLY